MDRKEMSAEALGLGSPVNVLTPELLPRGKGLCCPCLAESLAHGSQGIVPE